MAKILEKKTRKNNKEYKQYQVTIPPTVLKALNWKPGQEVEIKTDPQNVYAIVQKIKN